MKQRDFNDGFPFAFIYLAGAGVLFLFISRIVAAVFLIYFCELAVRTKCVGLYRIS